MQRRSQRRQDIVLDILRQSTRPMTAYEVLAGLKLTEGSATPPSAYRALAALTKAGHAHRLESMNAFVPCRCDGPEHSPVMAICDDCGTVEEHAEAAEIDRLTALAAKSAFRPRRHVVEIHGQCGACAAAT